MLFVRVEAILQIVKQDMNNFRQGDRSRDKRSSGRREMYDAVCDNCGKACKVPFKPSGDKPIYCSDCFEEKGGRDSGRQKRDSFRGRDSGGRSSSGYSQGNVSDRSVLQLSKSIENLSIKLDSIIALLKTSEKPEMPEKKAEDKKEKAPKTKKAESKKATKTG